MNKFQELAFCVIIKRMRSVILNISAIAISSVVSFFAITGLIFGLYLNFGTNCGMNCGLFSALIPTAYAQANLTPEQRAALEAELASVLREIDEQQKILNQKQSEGVSIERDIAILNAKIKQSQLEIKKAELKISSLGKDINIKTNTITALGERINNGQDAIGQVLRRTRELDNFSMAEAMLSNRNISEFFVDFDSFASIQESLKAQLEDIKGAKKDNEVAKEQLNAKRDETIDSKYSIEKEKKKVEVLEAEKKRILGLNKNEQQNYKNSISAKQKKANEIKNALFALRDSPSIKFGDAVVYAKAASSKTGVRAAFVLAIIQQESNLGSNVGSCYLTDTTTGAGVKKSSGVAVSNLMKVSRDIQPFLQIMKETGRDAYKTLVSCPIGGSGYGGAMGPSQFIPSTWMLNRDRVASRLGKSYVDPWNPEDAFMATALYLSDLGASAQSYTAERNAACKYYSGKSCSGSNTFYGNQVMNRVTTLQGNIDILSGN